MSLKRLIDVGTVSQLLKKKIINNEGVRILDCTYDHTLVAKKPDWKRFQNELYGNFEKLLSKQSKELYLSGHIPEAPHICLDLAMFPSEYERYALYPPETFQEYVQMLGINDDEHLILYSRGKYGGMLHASKFAWLFKAYGHEKLSLIDGGYEQWVKAGFTIDRDDVKLKRGAWKAVDNFSKYNVKFEELEEQHGIRIYIEYVDDLNLLDARVRGQFEGTVPTECPPGVVGTHIPGFKNLPAAELIEDGVMKSPEKIKAWLGLQHFNPNRPTVVMCDVGIQSAMVAYAIETVFPRSPIKVYNGSIREMELRNPKRISATFENV